MSSNILSSGRLNLIACTPELYEAILEGEEGLRSYLGISIADHWSHFGPASFHYAYRKIQEKPENMTWWSYLIIYRSEQRLIGSGGYKGPPNEQGEVEIGYEIAEKYQNRGMATEAAQALIDYAFKFPEIKKVKAHTLPEENASVQVLKKCGMKFVHTLYDPDDGDIWLWEIGSRKLESGKSKG